MSSAYLSFDGTDLHFDAVLTETTTHTARVTTHPVEDGPDITDHIKDELDSIDLEVFVTNQPIKDVNNLYSGAYESEAIEVVRKEPAIQGVTLDVPKYRPVPVTPGALMQTIGNAITDALADATVAQVRGKTEDQTLSAAISVLKWPTKFNAVQDTVNQLVEWKKKGVIGSAITPWKTFPSVVITKVSTLRNAPQGDGATVSITLQEIRLVESKLVTAPVPTEPRGHIIKNKGRQPTEMTRGTDKKRAILHVAVHGNRR